MKSLGNELENIHIECAEGVCRRAQAAVIKCKTMTGSASLAVTTEGKKNAKGSNMV